MVKNWHIPCVCLTRWANNVRSSSLTTYFSCLRSCSLFSSAAANTRVVKSSTTLRRGAIWSFQNSARGHSHPNPIRFIKRICPSWKAVTNIFEACSVYADGFSLPKMGSKESQLKERLQFSRTRIQWPNPG